MATAELEKTKSVDLSVADDAIAKMAEEFLQLHVESIDDREGLEAVHKARMLCVRTRGDIDKQRKKLNEDALIWQRTVNTEAKRLTALIAPIETHLENEEAIVEREKERIRKEEEARRLAKLSERLEALKACDHVCLSSVVEFMTDESYAELLAEKQAEKKLRDEQAAAAQAEQERIAAEQKAEADRLAKERAELDRQRAEQAAKDAEAKRIEDARIAAERAELDKQRQEQAAAQAKIDAERKRIDDEQAAEQRRLQLERAKAEAAENARLEAIKDQERKAADARLQAAAEEAELKRLESLRPDHQKLLAVADQIETIVVPPVTSAPAKVVAEAIKEIRSRAADEIRELANTLVKKKGKK